MDAMSNNIAQTGSRRTKMTRGFRYLSVIPVPVHPIVDYCGSVWFGITGLSAFRQLPDLILPGPERNVWSEERWHMRPVESESS